MEQFQDRMQATQSSVEAGTPTHCPYCAMQCAMTLLQEGERFTTAAREFPTNKGGMCRKGFTAGELMSVQDRLTAPLMREHRQAPLRPVSWEQALERIGSEIKAAQQRHGVDAIGVFGGGGLTNEKAYALGKFARVVLGTPNIDYNGRFCMSSAAVAGMKAFGVDRGLPFPLDDIPDCAAILMVGANPAESLPPIMQYFDEQKRRGGQLIVVDPRVTPTAAGASLHLQITPGTDGALANGLLYAIIQQGYLDREFIEQRTAGFEAVRRLANSFWPDRVERITGVPAKQIWDAARILGQAPTAMVLSARGTEQQSSGVANVLAFINLLLAMGKAGKPHCGYGCFTGQGNGQGGREHGQKADQLPGYRRLDNPEDRAHVAAVWGVPPESLPGPGVSATEMLRRLAEPGGVRALIVLASNIVVSAPDAGSLRPRIQALDFLLVGDAFLSETAALADVVLPVTQWSEEQGTMTNLEGRVILRQQAVEPPPGVRTDLQILKAIAERLGRGEFLSEDPRTVFDELRRASAGGIADYSGITYERIQQEQGVFWPCPGATHPGTPRLFLERFGTADGRARFHAMDHKPSAEEPDGEYPLFLTTGRVLSQYQSGTQTRRVPSLNQAEPQAFVEIHPQMARNFGITQGSPVRVSTRRGVALVKARLTTTTRMDTLFIPFHWGGAGSANLLTSTAFDPVSGIPEFKVCAARIERAEASAHEDAMVAVEPGRAH